MFCDDITPKPTPHSTSQEFAQRFPILAEHVGLPEPLAWERYRVAALIHDTERTPRTWVAKQTAYHEWAGVFLADEGKAA